MNRPEKNVKKCAKKQERPIIAFWHKNRKGILIATGIIGTTGTVTPLQTSIGLLIADSLFIHVLNPIGYFFIQIHN